MEKKIRKSHILCYCLTTVVSIAVYVVPSVSYVLLACFDVNDYETRRMLVASAPFVLTVLAVVYMYTLLESFMFKTDVAEGQGATSPLACVSICVLILLASALLFIPWALLLYYLIPGPLTGM